MRYEADTEMTKLQDGRSKVPNGPLPLQVFWVNPRRLTPQVPF